MSQNDRKRVLVLVVDDQLTPQASDNRTAKYQKALEHIQASLRQRWHLEVRLCTRPGDLHRDAITPGEPIIAIMDMVLDGEPWAGRVVPELDAWLLERRVPMLLVSQYFSQENALDRANFLAGQLAKRQVPFQILLWQNIEAAAADPQLAEQLAFPIGVMLDMAHGRDPRFQKPADAPIGILHITDAHFGKTDWNVGTLAILHGQFKDKSLTPADFLAITGDVANSGCPQEYQQALRYFHSLAHNGLMGSDSRTLPVERVFSVPGNHDFSRPLALSANIVTADHKSYDLVAQAAPDRDWLTRKARDPYIDFEESVTGRDGTWCNDRGFRCDTRFVGGGLVFLQIDLERNAIEGYQSGITTDELQQRLNAASTELRALRRAGECLIVLAHRHVDDRWSDLGVMLNNFFGGLAEDGPVVLFCGHAHDPKVGAEYDNRLLLVRGIPSTSKSQLPRDQLPLLYFVSLQRQAGQVNGARVHSFHNTTGRWLDGKPHNFSWSKEHGWR